MTAEYLTLAELSAYSGIAERTLRAYSRRSRDPLPTYQLVRAGKIRVKRAEFDSWMAQFKRIPTADEAMRIVDDVLSSLTPARS